MITHQSHINQKVCVFFEDPIINELFSDLLEARGVKTKIINSVNEVPLIEESRIITEPQFLPLLSEASKKKALIVGNKNALREVSALCLSRPLTEEKIEYALHKFLS